MVQGGVRNGSGSASPILNSSLTSRSLVSGMSPLQAALCKPLSSEISHSKDVASPAHSKPATPCPTSPGPAIKLEAVEAIGGRDTPGSGSLNGTFVQTLSAEKVASWGIIKMNDYLVSGTRQQYWEEYFVKNVMAAVKNKEIDMKGAAELLGVSYGTLYGRYRESFGYLKHAWNVTGRPQRKTNLWTDPNTRQILESMRTGAINIKQAAEALGMEPAMLAYQLAGKVTSESLGQIKMADNNGGYNDEDPLPISYDDEDYNEEMMEVQPDIILEGQDHEPEQFDSIVEEEGVDPIQS